EGAAVAGKNPQRKRLKKELRNPLPEPPRGKCVDRLFLFAPGNPRLKKKAPRMRQKESANALQFPPMPKIPFVCAWPGKEEISLESCFGDQVQERRRSG